MATYNEYRAKGLMFEQVREAPRFTPEELNDYFGGHICSHKLIRNWSDIYILYQKDTKKILGFLWAKPAKNGKHPVYHLVEMIEVNPSEQRKGYARDMIEMYYEENGIFLIPEEIISEGSAVPFWLNILSSLPYNMIDDKISIGKCLSELGYSSEDEIWENWHKTLSDHLPDDLAVESDH